MESGGIYAPWGYRGHRREQWRALKSDPELSNLLFEEPDMDDGLHERAYKLLGLDRKVRIISKNDQQICSRT